jgi:hypothetical protein
MFDDAVGAIWHELRRIAHLLAEIVARLVALEERMDRIDPPDRQE